MAAGACFATRNDVRTLQGDLAVLRAENARSDSVHRAQFQAAARRPARPPIRSASLNAFLVAIRHRRVALPGRPVDQHAHVRPAAAHAAGAHRAEPEAPAGHARGVRAAAGGSRDRRRSRRSRRRDRTGRGAAAIAAPQPGPSSALRGADARSSTRGSYAAARAAFDGFLEQFPTNDRAGEAQYSIARSYDLEGNAAAADSVYAIVVDKYPKADFARAGAVQAGDGGEAGEPDRQGEGIFPEDHRRLSAVARGAARAGCPEGTPQEAMS